MMRVWGKRGGLGIVGRLLPDTAAVATASSEIWISDIWDHVTMFSLNAGGA